MWTAFLIGLMSEFFGESKKFDKFLVKGFAAGIIGVIINLMMLLLISDQANALTGNSTLNNVTASFVIVPIVAAFIAVVIVKVGRYLSTVEIGTELTTSKSR